MEGFNVLKPLGDRIIIEVTKEQEQTSSGFVLPSSAQEKSQTGTIIAVGEGRTLDNGTKLPVSVQVGETVLFESYAGTEVKYDGKEYLVLHEKDLVAVIG
nr:co-chaperone GroES [Isobaculum melis]